MNENKNINSYPDAMSLSDLADFLKISTKLASKLLRENKIYSIKVGREYRVAKKNVLIFITGKQQLGA